MLESIRMGDVLQFVGFIIGGAFFFFGMRQEIKLVAQRLGFLEKKVDLVTNEIGKLGELLVQMGRYEERMLRYDEHMILMRKEIDALKHGEGFINSGRLANSGNTG